MATNKPMPKPPAAPAKAKPVTKEEKKADKARNKITPSWMPTSNASKKRAAAGARLITDVQNKVLGKSAKPLTNPHTPDGPGGKGTEAWKGAGETIRRANAGDLSKPAKPLQGPPVAPPSGNGKGRRGGK